MLKKKAIPAGIPSSDRPEIVSSLRAYNSVEECAKSHLSITHYGFYASWDSKEGQMVIKARPWKNWKARQEADMQNMGM